MKRKYLDEWIRAINADGRFGRWAWDVSFRTSSIKDIINKHSSAIDTSSGRQELVVSQKETI